MMRRLACSLAGSVATLALVSLSIGCGGSTQNETEGGADSGTKDTAPPVDSHVEDTGTKKEAAPDAPQKDSNPFVDTGFDSGDAGGVVIPSGAKLLVGITASGLSDLEVVGITDDNAYAIYFGTSFADGGADVTGVFAAPLAGGTPITILPSGVAGNTAEISIVHSTVFVWTNVAANATTGDDVGALVAIWTLKNGVVSPDVVSSTAGIAAASPDSSYVVYTANVLADGSSGDLVYAGSDLKTPAVTTLLSNTATNATATAGYFDPDLGFTNNTYFVAAHEEDSDSGPNTATISAWDTTTWTQVDLVTNALVSPALTSAYPWSTSTTGSGFGGTIVAATAAGALQAFVLPSAVPVAIASGVTSFYVKPDGSSVLYGTSGGAYTGATLPPTVPTDILTTGYGGFITGYGAPSALSPDGNWAIFYKKKGTTAGEFDLNLINNVASATSTSLLSSPTGAVFNDAFTADSKYGLYYEQFTPVGTKGAAGAVGHLWAVPVSTGAGVVIDTDNVWESNYLSGSKIIYNDNFVVGSSGVFGVADIYSVDVSVTPLAPTPIIKTADENYYLTTDRVTVVFALNAPNGSPAQDGLYAYKP